MDFKIYYADGTTYTGDAYLAPVWGVLVIVEPDRDMGRRIIQNSDYYVYLDGHWLPVDQVGFYDYLAQPGSKRVLFGRLVDNHTFSRVLDRALCDPDFPTKTADGRLRSKIQ